MHLVIIEINGEPVVLLTQVVHLAHVGGPPPLVIDVTPLQPVVVTAGEELLVDVLQAAEPRARHGTKGRIKDSESELGHFDFVCRRFLN